MSARSMASSVVCEPLPTHLDQPPLIPKRIKAARASTTTGINFLNHPLLSDTFSLGGGVVVSDDGFVSSGLAAVVPLLFDVVSTAAAVGFVSGIFLLVLSQSFFKLSLRCPEREQRLLVFMTRFGKRCLRLEHVRQQNNLELVAPGADSQILFR